PFFCWHLENLPSYTLYFRLAAPFEIHYQYHPDFLMGAEKPLRTEGFRDILNPEHLYIVHRSKSNA
ncbi:MAG: hypothetical protein KDK27_11975, partial [Leptospiraceae bacterium]|nr:hypothetical protein [Leptospiraceae bacterium]